jgi:hypothetical protein
MNSEGRYPTDIYAISVRFLTRPHDPPSGVSAGQTIPQWELWSYLGFDYFPFLSNGVVTLLKWDKNEANVSLLKT